LHIAVATGAVPCGLAGGEGPSRGARGRSNLRGLDAIERGGVGGGIGRPGGLLQGTLDHRDCGTAKAQPSSGGGARHAAANSASRICSHQDLPPELRTVEVFLYLMVYSDAQLKPLTKDEKAAADREEALLASTDPKTVVDVSNAALKYVRVSRELRENDTSSKTDEPITTDQSLYEIANRKAAINNVILRSVKETAIDCAIHAKAGGKETLKCFTFDNPENKFAYEPSLQDEVITGSDAKAAKTTKAKTTAATSTATATATSTATAVPLNKEVRKLKIKEITHEGVKYGIDIDTNDVYDYENLKIGNRVLVGKFVELAPGKFTIV
jgi:hypothetical protein